MANKQSQQTYVVGNEFLSVSISNRGASIQSIRFADQELCLGFLSQDERIKSGTYCGAVIGRVANRIADGKFTLNGVTYSLTKNDGENTLHGGSDGFDQRFFLAESCDDTSVTLMMSSSDGDQGFPGTLTMRVGFAVEKTSLTVRFSAYCDKDTVWAPTIHPYFRFGSEKVEETLLQINAEYYTPMNERQIPTGQICSVKGTPFDFRQPKKIGKDILSAELQWTKGYDHNFVLGGQCTNEEWAATVFGESSGIAMKIYTDMPGLHFYSGNFLKGFNGTHELCPHEGFALEPQFFPNAVNTNSFEQPLLKKGTLKTHYIKYVFNT